MSQKQAALKSGYPESAASVIGCRLDKKPQIKARIAELESTAAQVVIQHTAVSKGWMIEELQKLKALATSDKQYGTAAKCVIDIGKVPGVYSERADANDALVQVIGIVLVTGDISGLSEEQLENFRRAVRKLAEMPPKEIESSAATNETGPPDASSAVVDLTPEPPSKESWL